MSSSTQSHDSYIIRITTKRLNVVLYPLKRNIHVFQSQVQKAFFGGQLCIQTTKYTNAILHANSDVRLF